MVDIKWWEDPKAIGCPVKARDNETDSWSVGVLTASPNGSPMVNGCYFSFVEPLTADDLYKGEV